MSQVDISMFSTITQTVSIFGLVIYSFWLVSVFYFFMKNFNIAYKVANKSVQLIILSFNKF
jgi:hypothetical protein